MITTTYCLGMFFTCQNIFVLRFSLQQGLAVEEGLFGCERLNCNIGNLQMRDPNPLVNSLEIDYH